MGWHSATGACKNAVKINAVFLTEYRVWFRALEAMGQHRVPPQHVNMRSKSMAPLMLQSYGAAWSATGACKYVVKVSCPLASSELWGSLECHWSV